MNKFKNTPKDKAFEELIKDLQKLKGAGKEFNFGTSSTAKGSTNYTVELTYNGYNCKVELM